MREASWRYRGPLADLGGSLTDTGGLLANIGDPKAKQDPHASLADIGGQWHLANVGGPLAHRPAQETL